MEVQFSTSNEHEARKRMVSALGEYADDFKEFIDLACAQVARGALRIGDPTMYGQAVPFPTNTSTDADVEELKAAYDRAIKNHKAVRRE